MLAKIKAWPTLYGRASNKKIKQWNIVSQLGTNGLVEIVIIHGYAYGKKQIDRRGVKGKNIGKKNETTAFEQSCLEANSKYERKKDSGYVLGINNIPKDSDGMFLPMLAQRYDKHPNKVVWPCVLNPKFDGQRALVRKKNGVVTMWSRMGKPITIPKRIIQQLEIVLKEGECTDGELYVHGWTFQRLISAIKKESDDTHLLQYHIYDMPHETLTYTERFEKRWVTKPSETQIHVSDVTYAQNADDIMAYETKMLKQGYEGIMIRNPKSLYRFKHRSFDLLKFKRFQDSEYKIVGFTEGKGRETGLIVFTCVTDRGIEFGCRPEGTRDERAALYKRGNETIGKYITVRYFELSNIGVPRFPVGVSIRDYE